MSRSRTTTRRSLIVLAPLVAWLVVGALALDALASEPSSGTFCQRADALLWHETRSWNAGHPNGAATEGADAFDVFLARRIGQTDFDAAAPAPLRPMVAAVAHRLVIVDRAPTTAAATSELTDALERLLAAYRRACP